MSQRGIGWDDFWSFYRGVSKETKKDVLEQIDLGNFIRDKTWKVQFEMLDHAPIEIVYGLRTLLEPQALKRLGLVANKSEALALGMKFGRRR